LDALTVKPFFVVALGSVYTIPPMVQAFRTIQAEGQRKFLGLPRTSWFRMAKKWHLLPVLSTERHRWRFRGRIDDFPVEAIVSIDTVVEGLIEVCITLPEDFPADLRVRPETARTRLRRALGGQDIPLADPDLDRALEVRGRDESHIAAVLAYPTLGDAFRALFGLGLYVSISGRQVTVRDRSLCADGMDRAIGRAVELARLLSQQKTVWNDVAEEHMLEFEQEQGRKRLTGTVGGEAVVVTSEWTEDDWFTGVRVPVRGLSPDIGLQSGTGCLRDPVLDGVVSATGDPAALRALLTSPGFGDVRGVLLETIHTWPVARVHQGAVELGEPRLSGEGLESMVEAAVALATALADAVAAMEASA